MFLKTTRFVMATNMYRLYVKNGGMRQAMKDLNVCIILVTLVIGRYFGIVMM